MNITRWSYCEQEPDIPEPPPDFIEDDYPEHLCSPSHSPTPKRRKVEKDLFTKREVLDLVENHTNSKAVTDIILREMFDLDTFTVSDGENVEVERTKDIIRRRVDRLIATMKDKKMKLRVKRVSYMYLTITYRNRIYYLVDVLCLITMYN